MNYEVQVGMRSEAELCQNKAISVCRVQEEIRPKDPGSKKSESFVFSEYHYTPTIFPQLFLSIFPQVPDSTNPILPPTQEYKLWPGKVYLSLHNIPQNCSQDNLSKDN